MPKSTEMSLKNSGTKLYGLMRQRLTFDGKAKVWRKKDPKHTCSSVKHSGGHGLGLHGFFWNGLINLH